MPAPFIEKKLSFFIFGVEGVKCLLFIFIFHPPSTAIDVTLVDCCRSMDIFNLMIMVIIKLIISRVEKCNYRYLISLNRFCIHWFTKLLLVKEICNFFTVFTVKHFCIAAVIILIRNIRIISII